MEFHDCFGEYPVVFQAGMSEIVFAGDVRRDKNRAHARCSLDAFQIEIQHTCMRAIAHPDLHMEGARWLGDVVDVQCPTGDVQHRAVVLQALGDAAPDSARRGVGPDSFTWRHGSFPVRPPTGAAHTRPSIPDTAFGSDSSPRGAGTGRSPACPRPG